MAAPYVHCLVSREALKILYNDSSLTRFRAITEPEEDAKYFPFVCLGSVSPDLPYAAQRVGINDGKDENDWTWGDKFHKQNTGSFIEVGVQALRAVEDKKNELFLKQAAWLLGYYSHVITDLVVHAVVYELVGGCYEKHQKKHLASEVIQDSLLFAELYSTPPKELIDVKFVFSVLENCQVAVHVEGGATTITDHILDNDIAELWNSILKQNYSDFYVREKPNIQDWFRLYLAVMKLGTTALARDVAHDMAYQRSTEIPPGDKERYYSAITLPDGRPGTYRDDVFIKTVSEVAQRLKLFLGAISNKKMFASLQKRLAPWNLDKGTLSDTNPTFALWKGQTEFPFDCPGDPPAPAIKVS
jgi:Zinc dependent phospholipase C